MVDITRLEIDLDLKENLLVSASCKQLDDLTLVFNLWNYGQTIDLANYEVELRAMKSDQVPLIQNTNITPNGNVITIKSDYQLTTTSGIVECEICLINKSTKEKKFSFDLHLKVVKSVFEVDRSISKATYTLLEQLENKIDEVRDIGTNLDEAKVVNIDLKANILTGSVLNTDLKTDITNANASKVALDTSKTNADTSKKEVEAVTNSATTKKGELETATTNAELKKQEVITECGVADNKIQKMQSFGDVSNLVQDVTKLKENVATNTASLSENTQNIAQLSNPNLLINGDFKNPVNQRNLASYTSASYGTTYAVDRWLLYNSGVVLNVGLSGISVNAPANLIQRLEKKDYKKLIGKTITLSIKYTGTVATGTNPVSATIYDRISGASSKVNTVVNSGTNNIDANNHIFFITLSNFQANDVDYLEYFMTVPTGYTLEYAKLELGSIATPFVPRFYAEELALCQRYYRVGQLIGNLIFYSNDLTFYSIPISTMRIMPTLTNPLNLEVYNSNGTYISGFSFSLVSIKNNSITIQASKTSHGVVGGYLIVRETTGFDSEIY